MVNDCGALVSAPPPSSRTLTRSVADPTALLAGVNRRVPAASTVGGPANRAGFVFPVNTNDRAWVLSFGGPADRPVAQPATVCGPAFSITVRFPPAVKLGVSFTGVT